MSKKFSLSGTIILCAIVLFTLFTFGCKRANSDVLVSIIADPAHGEVTDHGLTKLKEALETRGTDYEEIKSLAEAKGDYILITGLAEEDGIASQMLRSGKQKLPEGKEALTTWKTEWQGIPVLVVCGADETGLMYGLLDVADRIGWSGKNSAFAEVKDMTERPYVSERAISLYTMNRAYWESRFYDEVYWERYLDLLAKNRFNSIVIIFGYENGGFMAPCYSYFFDVDGFPGIRINGISADEQQKNLRTLKRINEMANSRGIAFKLGIWDHIYRGGVQGGPEGLEREEMEKLPGRVRGVNAGNLNSYTKAALKKLILELPGLDGIQFRMHGESGIEKEEMVGFWMDVFKMIKQNAPGLSLDLRAKGLPDEIIDNAVKEDLAIRITTKYWMEQMGMPFHPSHINRQNQHDRRQGYADLLTYPQKYKFHWRLWTGGTTRLLLWGDPQYVRRFAESTHLYDGEGYEVNEPLATKMHFQLHDADLFDIIKPEYQYYDYEFERYWHFFQVFGRIGYNPDTDPDTWQKEFEMRFGANAAPLIEEAMHKASWILPRIVSSCYPYKGFPTTRGWAAKQALGDLSVYATAEGSDIQQFLNFEEESQLLIGGGETARVRPSVSRQWFAKTSADIDKLILGAEEATGKDRSKEFNSTITDLKILSGLALYHSRRIPAAVSYCIFKHTRDVSALDEAIKHEANAIEAWKEIVSDAGDMYNENLRFGVHELFQEKGIYIGELDGHWRNELEYLEEGLATLKMERENYTPDGNVIPAPRYKELPDDRIEDLFRIEHQAIVSAPVDQALKPEFKVSAVNGIKWVRLRYRNVNQMQDYHTLELQPSGQSGSYSGIVPVEDINTQWDFMYFLEVMDRKGNGRIYPDLNKETPYFIVSLTR